MRQTTVQLDIQTENETDYCTVRHTNSKMRQTTVHIVRHTNSKIRQTTVQLDKQTVKLDRLQYSKTGDSTVSHYSNYSINNKYI